MKNLKLKFISLVITFITIVGGMIILTLPVEAALPTTEEVYQNVPDGLKLDGLIEHPNFGSTQNNARLITDYQTNIIEMLNANGNKNQISSFWGKKYSDADNTKIYNSFRLDKPQTISAWLYLGDTFHNYPDSAGVDKVNYDNLLNSDLTADGIALVLQDDSRGATAISTTNDGKSVPSYGETLGVWAGSTADHKPITSGSVNAIDNFYKGGIQKSFAIELDTLQNYKRPTSSTYGQVGTDDYFDYDSNVKGQHIAPGYPGDNGSYNLNNDTYGFILGGNYFFPSLNHQTGTKNNIEISGYGTSKFTANVNKAWKHLTFHYTPPTDDNPKTGMYSLSFNDQNRDGTAVGFFQKDSTSGTIDLNKINTESKNIRWGFTASTGSKYSAPRTYSIVMQQMPNTANIDNTARLFDMSQYATNDTNSELGREIGDLLSDSSYKPNPTSKDQLLGFDKKEKYNVGNNDKLLFQYDLNYDSGTLDTGEITTKLHLPNNVDFKTGLSDTIGSDSIGKVVYSGAGSDSSKSFEISANDVVADADSGDQVLNMSLPSMDTEGQHATIYLYGQANETTTPIVVSGEQISYRSEHYISDVTSPTFIINDQLHIDASDTEQTVNADEDVKMNGSLNYVGNSTFDSKKVGMHIKVNGTDLPTGEAATTSGSKTGSYMMEASSAISNGSLLKIGENKIELYAIDSLSRVSNKITYNVTVKDYKDLILKATGDNPQTLKTTDPIVLTNDVSYSNDDTVNMADLKGSYKIDNDDSYTAINPSSGTTTGGHLTFKLPAGTLGSGKHTIKLYLTDSDGRNSNEVIYDIIVVDRNLVLTPTETDLNQIVHDNSNVKLTGNYAYSDNSDFSNEVTTIKYQITDADGNKQAEVTQDVTDKIVDGSKFTVELKPIGANLFDNNSQQAVTDYLKDATGLKVGRNQIDVTAYDGETASNTATYVVDVPDITPTIEATKSDLTAISNLPVRLPMTFTYPDVNAMVYQLQAKDAAVFVQVEGSTDTPIMTVADRPKSADKKITTPYKLNPKSTWTDDLPEGNYKINAYVMDRYLRKTNTVNYNVKVVPTGAQVEVENYRFKTIDPRGKLVPSFVQREGSWNIKVDSYKSKWKLHAQADTMKRQDEFGDYSEDSNLQMVQLNDDNTAISLSENPVVATGDSTGIDDPISYSLFDETSDPNTGILLGTRGVPLSGEYQSTVTWSINDTV